MDICIQFECKQDSLGVHIKKKESRGTSTGNHSNELLVALLNGR